MKTRYVVLILGILCLIILLPPIIHGYVYPNGGDDTGHHLMVIESILIGQPLPKLLYAGQAIVGYPLALLKGIVPIPISFMWFNYLVLIGIVLTDYFVFSKLVNQMAGILTALVGFFLSTNIPLFQAGAIFNLVNMGIVLPWILYFGITTITHKSWKRAVACNVLIVFFVFFHATGIYLLAFIPIAAVGWIFNSQLKTTTIMILYFLGAMALCLLLVAFTFPKLSPDSGRQAVDAVGLIWIFGAIAISVWLPKLKYVAIFAVIIVGSYFTLPNWFTYQSAIKPVDKEAIAYVNSLPESQFYGNRNVAPYIYQPFLNKTYSTNGTGIYVWRSEPQTWGLDNLYWKNEGRNVVLTTPDNILSVRDFSEDGIEVKVYVMEVMR